MRPREHPQIVTFYSFKGGTGRSMMLANVAWILASNGRRVLAIDWDLEAPGLHRYFQPFLLDQDLVDTEGVIDFVTDFAVAAVTPKTPSSDARDEEPWFHPYADISRYATSLDWDFGPGTLDFVCAGRQGSSYSTRVNAFQWQDFYERFGGGAFLEQMKTAVKARYEYVLIDSRTGVSDASGICTIQLPDTLVVCFTLNNQSVDGAARVAATVAAQRADMRILPVPMRIENSEKEKLDLRRTRARRRFAGVLTGDERGDPERYWSAAEVPYVPYYAYEEILAAFGDRSGSPLTMLAAAERLTKRLDGEVARSVRISESTRAQTLAAYEGTIVKPTRRETAIPGGNVYISYRRMDTGWARRLYDDLASALGTERVVIDIDTLSPGADYVAAIEDAVRASAVVVALIGHDWASPQQDLHRSRLVDPNDAVHRELATALATDHVRVIPALLARARMPSSHELPDDLAALVRRQAIELSDTRWDYDVRRLIATIELAIADSNRPDVSDPGDESTPFKPSAGTAEVIDSVLRGGGPARRSRALELVWRRLPVLALAGSSLLSLLVLADVLHLGLPALAAVVLGTNTAVVFLLSFASPGSAADAEQPRPWP